MGWSIEPSAPIAGSGVVRFERANDSTRVQIRLSVRPPAGAIGHSISWIAGVDPKSALDDDLVRMKTYIERGVQPHDAAQRSAR
jgi:uncharacterized membrane protein